MLSTDFKILIAPKVRVLNMIWGAIAFAPVMYVGVAWFLFGQTAVAPSDTVPLEVGSGLPLTGIGLGLLLVLGFSATFYQKKSFSGNILAKKMAGDPVWPSTGSKDCGREIFLKLPEGEQRLAGLWPHYQTTMIVVWTMLESIAVVGLILTIMERDFRVVIPFAAAAVILMVMKMPRPARFFAGLR